MEQKENELNPKWEEFVSALTENQSISAAAQQVGISRTTAWRWLKDPDFQALYREARQGTVQSSMASLQTAMEIAIDTLREVAQDREVPAGARVSAARTIIEKAFRSLEVEDLDARLTTLEQGLKKGAHSIE